MKQWYLALISIGCVFMMLSFMMPNPIFLIITGVILVIIGFMQLKKGNQ